MTTIVDSHCHLDRLDVSKFENGLDDVIQQAAELGVEHMLCVSIDMENVHEVKRLASVYDNVFASVGTHPTAKEQNEPTVETLIELANDDNVVAIGETGLDYYHCEGDMTWQHDRFRTHIQASKQTGKPLIIHTRDAKQDTIKIMREEGAEQARGVMHCFVEDLDTAQQAMEMGFYISFSGIVTFKNAKELQAVAKEIPLEKLLVETDSPYLTPVPYRGKPNYPGYTRYVAEYIAELKGTSVEEIAKASTENFFTLFNTASS
ncbi:MAG: TatD family hydrolase [Gammaproteobacteria bacterium]|nr:TatD family hydrolase [Gammaproteobacteria bacterium]